MSPVEKLQNTSTSESEDDSFKSVFNLIYRDNLEKAYEKLDSWSIKEINHHATRFDAKLTEARIFNLMKLVKYCQEWLSDSTQKPSPGEDSYNFWQNGWNQFEEFIRIQSIYHEANYIGMKNYFYQKMIDNLILEFNSQSYYKPIMLEACKKLLEIGSWDKTEEGLNYLIKSAPKLLPEVQLQLIGLYYYQGKTSEAYKTLKDLLFAKPLTDLSSLPIPEIKILAQRLFLDGFKDQEIQVWLGVYLRTNKLLPVFYSLNNEDYKKAIILLDEWEKSEYEDEETYTAILIYRYLYVMDQIYTRIVKGKEYLRDDLDHYLTKLKRINHFIYKQVINNYES